MTRSGPSARDRYRGCLLGGAVGDSLGAAVEFDDLATIRRRFGPTGIQDPATAFGRVGAITDDTQMTLFTAEGLLQADDRLDYGIGYPPARMLDAYHRWLFTQGVAPRFDGQPSWHGELHRLPAMRSRRAPGSTFLSAHSADGEVHDALRAALDASRSGAPPSPDVVEQLGAGWVAEEALAIAVYCALIHHDDFAAAVLSGRQPLGRQRQHRRDDRQPCGRLAGSAGHPRGTARQARAAR